MNLSQYTTVEDTAKNCKQGYTADHIRRLCREGKIEGVQRIGRSWLIPKGALDRYHPAPQGFAAVKARKEREQGNE